MTEWTRNDLPDEGELADLIRDALDGGIYEGKMLLPGSRLRAIIDLLVRWLNAHHPKPGHPMGTESARWRRERDEALRKKGEMVDRAVRAERERDAAVARADQLRDERDEALSAGLEALGAAEKQREEIADQFATFRADIVAEAVKARESAVTRADIENQLRIAYESGNHPIERIRVATDAVCDLFGVEAEQATDPVEQKARELFDVANADALIDWERTSEGMRGQYRRLAAHILGLEATR